MNGLASKEFLEYNINMLDMCIFNVGFWFVPVAKAKSLVPQYQQIIFKKMGFLMGRLSTFYI